MKNFLALICTAALIIPANSEPIECGTFKATGKYTSRLQFSLPYWGRHCVLTIRPKSDMHLVKLTYSHTWHSAHEFDGRPFTCQSFHYDDECTTSALIIFAKGVISEDSMRQVASHLYSNKSEDLSRFIRDSDTEICHCWHRSSNYQPVLSLGSIRLMFMSRPNSFPPGLSFNPISQSYELDVEQVPYFRPGSSDLCPKPTQLTAQYFVREAENGGRFLSVRQMVLKSPAGDCRTSVLMDPPIGRASPGNKLMVSVNCSNSTGSLDVLVDVQSVQSISAISAVKCNSVTQLAWRMVHEPVTLVAEGTGGFTARLEHLKWISDGAFSCPKYTSANGKAWIANLPFLIGSSSHQDAFYCQLKLSPPPGHDLMVQLHLSLSANSLDRFCSLLSSGANLRPRLSFTMSVPETGRDEVHLCDQHMPGGLLMRSRVRVVSGASLTVDLVATQLNAALQHQLSFTASSLRSEMDAVIVVHQVDSCPSPSNFSSWQLSHDRTQILNTLTVVPGNSQTNCNLHLNAASAVSIANEKQIHKPNAGSDGCWNLRVMIHRFDTTCGLHQLMLTVSYWDSVAASTVHKQKEVCGNGSSFTWTGTVLMRALNDTGMSLWFSGVRSGFVAQFSVSPCDEVVETEVGRTYRLVSAGDSDTTVPLTLIVLVLALGNLCVVLVAARPTLLRIRMTWLF